jgi:hypothetical protein
LDVEVGWAPVDYSALVVAVIAAVAAVASAVYARHGQREVANLQARLAQEAKEEEERSKAKQVLDRYRGPLLDAVWQLGNRVDNIRHRRFLVYLAEGSGREQDAKLTTLFRFAQYFGWREFIRREAQLLRFENEADTRLVSGFLNDVASILTSDKLGDAGWAMLWVDEQRGIGELMASDRPDSPGVRGHASFHRDYEGVFAPWMERFAGDLLSEARALKSERLRLLQWALFGLVGRLDEEGSYYGPGGWTDSAEQEIRKAASAKPLVATEARLREHLAELDQLVTRGEREAPPHAWQRRRED